MNTFTNQLQAYIPWENNKQQLRIILLYTVL